MWIIATLSAAFFQTLRFMLQKHLSTAGLSAGGSTFARFVFAAPVVVILLAFYLPGRGVALPHIGGSFRALCGCGRSRANSAHGSAW